jgi:putative tributyrin esterase
MVRHVRRAAVAALVTGAAIAAVAVAAGGTRAAGTISYGSLPSKALAGRLQYAVYLPADYATSGERYPVVYFLHGLPASPYAYRGIGFIAQALELTGKEAIVVAPQGARDGDTDPEWLDWGPGRNWETAVAKELVSYVDAHYRTVTTRGGRALVGVSAGGYGAVLLALHHLETYSVIESWSGYFHATDPTGRSPLEIGSPQANAHASAHTYVPRLRRAFQQDPTFFAFYVGTGDARFRAENEELDRELASARVAHVFELYPGSHEQSFWAAHAVTWLRLALDRLTPPR